jgi:diaminohydroxyphosphoribosylaminopyrimidine deaminase/5-amino-6-(5-phosphoribosylamino)uracil reductase
MSESEDLKFMKRAVELSKNGYGFVNPNPLVGAVIVKNGKIIGEGYHEYFGGPHAEINALKNVVNAHNASLYVTLEPCNHFGKTPPCTDRIILEKFARVVIGMKDPNPLVNGKGIKKLKSAGILVETGILKKEIQKLNEVYNKYSTTRLPFIALKTAMTLDGKISTFSGDSKWISNDKSRNFVHELRHRYSAIMVGVNTVIKDNPELTDRSGYSKKKHPVRIIVDSNGRTPVGSKVLDTSIASTIIGVTKNTGKDFINLVNKKGCDVIICPEKNNKIDLSFLTESLGRKGIDSILLEGGSTLNFSAIQEGIVDKVYSFISPKMFGGEKANTPLGGSGFNSVDQAITLNIEEIIRFDEDLMIESYIIKN